MSLVITKVSNICEHGGGCGYDINESWDVSYTTSHIYKLCSGSPHFELIISKNWQGDCKKHNNRYRLYDVLVMVLFHFKFFFFKKNAEKKSIVNPE